MIALDGFPDIQTVIVGRHDWQDGIGTKWQTEGVDAVFSLPRETRYSVALSSSFKPLIAHLAGYHRRDEIGCVEASLYINCVKLRLGVLCHLCLAFKESHVVIATI